MAGLFHYFVEGECEAVLLKAFMHAEEKEYGIYPGKIEILNPLYQKISPTKAMTLKKSQQWCLFMTQMLEKLKSSKIISKS